MPLTCSRYPLTARGTTVSDPPARLVIRLEAFRINHTGGLRPAVFALTMMGAITGPVIS